MKLIPPLLDYTLTQAFGSNANSSYAEQGLKGHTGCDFRSYPGDIVMCSVDSYCYSILNKDNPDPMKYRAVCTLYEDEEGWHELIYGHLDRIFVTTGTLAAAEPIGTEGNTGTVYSNGVLVTKQEKLAGSKNGYHLHWQKRSLVRVKEMFPLFQYLLGQDGKIYQDSEGFVYRVLDFENGYNGTVDPLPSMEKPTLFVLLNMYKRVLDLLKGRANHFK